jgi:hypothetical protein
MVEATACESSSLNFYRMFESVVECCPELNSVIACCSIEFSLIGTIRERNALAYVPDKIRQSITWLLRGSYPSKCLTK